MDATFSDEQDQLAEVAGRIAEHIGTGIDPATDRVTAWRLVADAGLLGLRLPEEAGGSGAGGVEVAIVAEALGRQASPVPFIGPVLAAELLRTGHAPDETLQGVADGQRRISLGLDGSMSGLAISGRGTSMIGWDGAEADDFAVLAPIGGALGVALVSGPGVVRNSTDLTRTLVTLDPGAPPVTVGAPVSEEALVTVEALGLTLLSADMVGAMQGALDVAVHYAKQRVQFKRPIGSFQAIQHLAAEQHVSVEASRSATYYAAWAVDGLGPYDALAAARTAKAYVSARAQEVVEAVLQIHGGIGHTWEHIAHYYLRRVLLDRFTLGDEHVQLAHIAGDTLVGRPGTGSEVAK
jgi:alkylation response protein AidB-like acyl-CoA dehydrogenase